MNAEGPSRSRSILDASRPVRLAAHDALREEPSHEHPPRGDDPPAAIASPCGASRRPNGRTRGSSAAARGQAAIATDRFRRRSRGATSSTRHAGGSRSLPRSREAPAVQRRCRGSIGSRACRAAVYDRLHQRAIATRDWRGRRCGVDAATTRRRASPEKSRRHRLERPVESAYIHAVGSPTTPRTRPLQAPIVAPTRSASSSCTCLGSSPTRRWSSPARRAGIAGARNPATPARLHALTRRGNRAPSGSTARPAQDRGSPRRRAPPPAGAAGRPRRGAARSGCRRSRSAGSRSRTSA